LDIGSAFRAFFALLGGSFPEDIARKYGFTKASAAPKAAPAAPPKPQFTPADGALQLLSILQRDARLVDFLMEDISAYEDDQVGAAVRNIHQQSRETLDRYIKLTPLVDGVEGDFTKTPDVEGGAFKLIGNVPANGKAPGGLLRHKGWKVQKIDLPQLSSGQNVKIVAPAELEIE
jgi:hypothetical protein